MTFKWTMLLLLLLALTSSCTSTVGVVKKQLTSGLSAKAETDRVKGETETGPTQDEGAFHIVGEGETLKHICEVYGLEMKKVAGINRLEAPYRIKRGDTIFLPADALLDGGDGEPRVCTDVDEVGRRKSAGNKLTACGVATAIRGNRHPSVPRLKFPVAGGALSSPFGHRWGVFHKGLDIAAPIGTSILACADGHVIFTGTRKKFRSYGNIVLVDHGDGVYTQYAHLHKILVKKGQRVRCGQGLGQVGNSGRSTGPHLHLEVRVRNQLYNPLAYFSPPELKGIEVAKRFSNSPMGPVRAQWRIPDLLTENR
jgi:murein DD-endopeptidase MepM/ murein hydrolase activator NlpD